MRGDGLAANGLRKCLLDIGFGYDTLERRCHRPVIGKLDRLVTLLLAALAVELHCDGDRPRWLLVGEGPHVDAL